MQTMALARSKIAKVTAKLRTKQALLSTLPPATRYYFQPRDSVQVYKEKDKKWCGPVKIIKMRDKNVPVSLGIRTQIYCISVALSYRAKRFRLRSKTISIGTQKLYARIQPRNFFSTEILQHTDSRLESNEFLRAVSNGLKGFMYRECFPHTNFETFEERSNVISTTTRFVFTTKNARTLEEKTKHNLFYKNIWIRKRIFFSCESANLRHSPQRIIISFASITHFILWSQNIIQAFLQSDQPLKRTVYLIPRKQLNHPKGTI